MSEGACMRVRHNHKYAEQCEILLVSARGVCVGLCFHVSRGELLPGMCSHMQSDE